SIAHRVAGADNPAGNRARVRSGVRSTGVEQHCCDRSLSKLPLSCRPRPSGRDDPVIEQYAATALAKLDGAADGAVPFGGELRGLADERLIEVAVAGNLVEQADLGEGLRPIRLTIALRPNRERTQRLLHLL